MAQTSFIGSVPLPCDLQPLEPLDVEHKDGGTTYLYLDGVERIGLADLTGGGGDEVFGAGLAVVAQDEERAVEALFLNADQDGGIALAQEPADRIDAGGAEATLGERFDYGPGVFILHDGEDELVVGGAANVDRWALTGCGHR